MILVRNKLSQWILGAHFRAMCIWPVLFVRPSDQLADHPATLNHEKIHARQQLEMLWLFFFLWYGLEFLVRYLQLHDRLEAYRALSHEKEAHANDENPGYLKQRKVWAWIRYI